MKDELNWNPKQNFGVPKMTWFLHLGRSGFLLEEETTQPTNQFRFRFHTLTTQVFTPIDGKPLKKTRPRQKKNSYLKIFKRTSN